MDRSRPDRQVVTNLIENALRYGSEGTEIVVSSAPWRDAVEVRVTDQGPGVPRMIGSACSSLSYAARRRGRVVRDSVSPSRALSSEPWRLHLDRGSARRRRVIRPSGFREERERIGPSARGR